MRVGRPSETVISILIGDAGIGGLELVGQLLGARLAPVRRPPHDLAREGDAGLPSANAATARGEQGCLQIHVHLFLLVLTVVGAIAPVFSAASRLRQCAACSRWAAPPPPACAPSGWPEQVGVGDERPHVADRIGMPGVPRRRAGELRHVVGHHHAVDSPRRGGCARSRPCRRRRRRRTSRGSAAPCRATLRKWT